MLGFRASPMSDADTLTELSHQIAAAIALRDVARLRGLLAPGFVARSMSGPPSEADAFLNGIASIPAETLFVRVENLQIDVEGDGALVTGVQQAQLRIDGNVVEDRRSFVDYFVRSGRQWKLRVAIDFGGA